MNTIEKKRPVKMLIGTDWWTDCDDAVAMRVLAFMHKQKQIEILGIGIDACMDFSAVSLDAFLRSEGLPDIPIGIDLDATDFGGKPTYQIRLSQLPSKYEANEDCEDPVRLYRKALGSAAGKTDIVEIGFPQILTHLIQSQPDDISDLSGMDLVKEKVNKLWMMAGKWDDLVNGIENNFARNGRSRTAAHFLCDNWPTPITFLGFEISSDILTGDVLPHDDVLYQIMADHGSPNGRSSWDPMLVLMACINDEKEAGYSVVRGKASVEAETGINHFTVNDFTVNDFTINDFTINGKGLHQYVVKDFEDNYYKQKINEILLKSNKNT